MKVAAWICKQTKELLLLATALEILIGLLWPQPILWAVFLVVNGSFFVWYLRHIEEQRQALPQNSSRPVDISVKIANETLPYLRSGLNEQNAEAIAKIILEISQVAAVSITDCNKQLAYLGAGCDQHHPGDKILTQATREVIQTGCHKVVQTQQELNCPKSDICQCPLAAAVIVPLLCRDNVVGTFKLYETKNGTISPDLIRLALGMGQILSLQVELAELDHQATLLTEAKLDALQAQINPHFFFNVLNTIIATSRTNPNRARRLLIHLSEFFRRALRSKAAMISLYEEMEIVNIYLVLEKARFGPKLKIRTEIPRALMDAVVPRLSIQPLVENAVKHGITPKLSNGTVLIRAFKIEAPDGQLELLVEIGDDGVGIEKDRLKDVLLPGVGSGNGVGLANVHARLQGMYGEKYGIRVESEVGLGSTVRMRLPYTRQLKPASGYPQDPAPL